MRSFCVIPARGGSKRIPRKNIRQFVGKPIIAYSIEAAQQAGCFEDIIVSTDDEEIAEVAESFGAAVPFMRPGELAKDYAGTIPVVSHAIRWMEEVHGSYDAVCCIYATAPFVQVEHVLKGRQLIFDGWSYALPATEFPAPIFRSFRKLPEGGVEMFFPEFFNTRSQDLETALHDAGQFYWGTADAWKNEDPLFGECSFPIEIPRRLVQDIDTEEDWVIAESLFRATKERARNAKP